MFVYIKQLYIFVNELQTNVKHFYKVMYTESRKIDKKHF